MAAKSTVVVYDDTCKSCNRYGPLVDLAGEFVVVDSRVHIIKSKTACRWSSASTCCSSEFWVLTTPYKITVSLRLSTFASPRIVTAVSVYTVCSCSMESSISRLSSWELRSGASPITHVKTETIMMLILIFWVRVHDHGIRLIVLF